MQLASVLNKARKFPFKRLLLIVILLCGISVGLVMGALLSFPALVSLPSVQQRLKHQLGNSLKRTVNWSELRFTWQQGITISGLSLGNGPSPLIRGDCADLTLTPRLSYGNGRLRADLSLTLRGASLALAPGPPAPPKPYKEPLTALAKMLQSVSTKEWALPIDLGVIISLSSGRLTYSDPKSGKDLQLDQFALQFCMPSLADDPLAATANGTLSLSDRRLEPVRLRLDLHNLVTGTRRITPAAAFINLQGSLPGAMLTISGGLREKEGFRSRLSLNLSRFASSVDPFLPPTTPHISGQLTADLKAWTDSGNNLQADLQLHGADITVKGIGAHKAGLGPLQLTLKQEIVTDYRQERVHFANGSASLLPFGNVGWDLLIKNPSRKEKAVTAQLTNLSLDLKPTLLVASPWLPPTFPLRALEGRLYLRNLQADLALPERNGTLSIGEFGAAIPRLVLQQANGTLKGEGVEIELQKLTAPLRNLRPTALDGVVSLNIRRLFLPGKDHGTLEGISGRAAAKISSLTQIETAPRRFSATVELQQSLQLDTARLGEKFQVKDLRQESKAALVLHPSGAIVIDGPGLKVTAKGLTVSASGKKISLQPLDASVSALSLRFPANGRAPEADQLQLTCTAADAIQIAASGNLSGTEQAISSTGTLRIDLGRVLLLAASFLPKGTAGEGTSTLSWDIAAPLKPVVMPPEKNILRRLKALSRQLHHGTFTWHLDSRALSFPLSGGNLKAGTLRTSLPLTLSVDRKKEGLRLHGGLTWDTLSGLPGSASKLEALNGTFSLRADLAGWQQLQLREELALPPLGVVQSADIAISRIDRLMEQAPSLTIPALLKHLDGELAVDMNARLPRKGTTLPNGLRLAGDSHAGIRVNLVGGRELKLNTAAQVRDFDLLLKNGTSAEGVTGDLLFSRTYALNKEEQRHWVPLSRSLVRPESQRPLDAGSLELSQRIRDDLRGEESGSRRFTVKRIRTRIGTSPLELTALEGDLRLNPEEMGVSFLQTELLGGTLRLRSMFDLKPEVPTLAAGCLFSNLETVMLLSQEARRSRRDQGNETAITGELSADLPLLTSSRELLEGMRLKLNLRRIGKDTLERILFSLDPYERNEQMVAQRKLLRHGTLKGLRAQTLDGAFSLEGDVAIKGVTIALPPVERVRLSELPIGKEMAKSVQTVLHLRKGLELLRADTLWIDDTGKISLVRRKHAE